MRNVYLFLAVVGFIAPNIFVAMVSVETGNILLWLDPMETISGMFANKMATAFMIDLLMAVLVFMLWSYSEAKKHGMKNIGFVWVLAFMFGLAGAFPLFLYLRERKTEQQ